MAAATLVFPGQPLSTPEAGPSASLQPGDGTYTRGGQVFASKVGRVHRDGGTISVTRSKPLPSVPSVGSTITGLITRLTRPQAHLSIVTVDGLPLPPGQDFPAVIRSQDVRAVEKDKVKVWSCFRPGDVVRAEVISLPAGPGGYLLSTAKNHLGVVFARHTTSGTVMRAVSWEEMEDPDTGDREPRKVAGPKDSS